MGDFFYLQGMQIMCILKSRFREHLLKFISVFVELSKAVQDQCFFEFRRQLEYKCREKGIPVVTAEWNYPSSKLCSCCGKIKKDLKLSERIYRCDCGNVVDRDLQAAINLKRYGERMAS